MQNRFAWLFEQLIDSVSFFAFFLFGNKVNSSVSFTIFDLVSLDWSTHSNLTFANEFMFGELRYAKYIQISVKNKTFKIFRSIQKDGDWAYPVSWYFSFFTKTKTIPYVCFCLELSQWQFFVVFWYKLFGQGRIMYETAPYLETFSDIQRCVEDAHYQHKKI